MAHGHADGNHGDHAAHEKHYIKIWGLLLGLLLVSVAGPLIAAEAFEEGSYARLVVTLITAFGVALVKAYYVVKYFMHLNLEPKYVSYLCATALAFLALFFSFVAPDVMNHVGANCEEVDDPDCQWRNVAAIDTSKRREVELSQEHGHGHGHGDHHEPDIEPERPRPPPPPRRVIAPEPVPSVEPSAVEEPPSPQPGISDAEREQRARFIQGRLFGH